MTLGYKALCRGDLKEAEQQIDDFEMILERQRDVGEVEKWQMAHVYYVLLRSTLAIRSGDISKFSVKGSHQEGDKWNGDALPSIMTETLRILDTLDPCHDPFGWLKRSELEAALLSNFMVVLLNGGRPQAVLEMSEQLNARLPLTETDEDSQASELMIWTRYISMETKARMHLLTGQPIEAQDEIHRLIQFVDGHTQQQHKLRLPLLSV